MFSFQCTPLLLPLLLILISYAAHAENLIVEIEEDPNNEKYSRAWSLWKFCGCSTAGQGGGTLGGLGAIADLWSMGDVFADMNYDVDYMPLDPFLVHINTTWLYSPDFYSTVVADYLASENKTRQNGMLSEQEVQAAEKYVYDVLAQQEQEVHLEYVHIGWDTVDEEGVFSFITDFRGHLPVRQGDQLCWDGMHMYNVSTADIESVMNVLGVGGLALDFHVNEGKNLCKDVTGW
ncbi:expressed unknown protein [Seminavis robusta]|uniref:Uncharacterized protein n=1 Tax=Seminavis robusta TaxID=568900 RepID=A0A9N8H790_9STRA|nr:expressed unknown protein [Seminavis robusta]|eukprot:Sro122_g059190.1 n/a (234) ;mRNA; r:40839-41540